MKTSIDKRRYAARAINYLRNDYSRKSIAENLGLPLSYISFAQGMMERSDCNGYYCPGWAIEKILNFARTENIKTSA